MWEKDSQIDADNLHTESLKVPALHAKYHEMFNNFLLLRKKAEQQRKNIRHERYEYYSGKADPEIYREEPLDHTILKTDLDSWIKADKKYIHACEQLVYAEAVLDLYKRTVDNIPNRSFYINNFIDLLKFENGER